METIHANQGDTVDAICWRYYGRTAGVTEAVLEANPGLADLGPILPMGQTVHLPAITQQAEQQTAVNLWD
ncbi:MAG: tail protein X [Halopseudomonas sp.]|uniref:tail protein X n=1 Tax=Halopseudomonas sp. TaxID=2901191 RepID=UPI0030027BD7